MRSRKLVGGSPLAILAATDALGVNSAPVLGSVGMNSPNKAAAQAVGQAVAIHNALSNYHEVGEGFRIPFQP